MSNDLQTIEGIDAEIQDLESDIRFIRKQITSLQEQRDRLRIQEMKARRQARKAEMEARAATMCRPVWLVERTSANPLVVVDVSVGMIWVSTPPIEGMEPDKFRYSIRSGLPDDVWRAAGTDCAGRIDAAATLQNWREWCKQRKEANNA